MTRYHAYSDDFYINVDLNTEMDLPNSRETLLHYFEQVQKKYPTMRNFYNRDRAEWVLEEEKDRGHYRWTTVEPRRTRRARRSEFGRGGDAGTSRHHHGRVPLCPGREPSRLRIA